MVTNSDTKLELYPFQSEDERMNMRKTLINILKERGSLKPIELAIAFWAHIKGIDLTKRNTWTPNSSEREELDNIEKAIYPILIRLEEEGLIEISPEPQYFKWVRLAGRPRVRKL